MDRRLIEFKIGTSSLTSDGAIDTAKLQHVASQLAPIHEAHDLIGVVSGAIALGRHEWAATGHCDDLDEQVAAMLGSAQLIEELKAAFRDHGMLASQLLITHHEIEDTDEGGVLRAALKKCINSGIIPLANENDALSTYEIKQKAYGGENDGLAGHIAEIAGAHTLMLLTDQPGMIDTDGNLIRTVGLSEEEIAAARAHIVDNGKGKSQGMHTKFQVATEAVKRGVHVVIGNAAGDYNALLNGDTGTHFLPDGYSVQY